MSIVPRGFLCLLFDGLQPISSRKHARSRIKVSRGVTINPGHSVGAYCSFCRGSHELNIKGIVQHPSPQRPIYRQLYNARLLLCRFFHSRPSIQANLKTSPPRTTQTNKLKCKTSLLSPSALRSKTSPPPLDMQTSLPTLLVCLLLLHLADRYR